jgi:hypothetical protein
MSDTAFASDLVGQIIAKGSITAQDVLALRREVFGDGVVAYSEAELVFRLDGACAQKDRAWKEFYVDALTDYFVWQNKPAKYVSEEQAQFLIDNIVKDGHVSDATELELLINIVHWSLSCPEKLVLFVLEAALESVLTPDAAAYGRGRRPGVITPVDVEVVRKAIYGPGSGGSCTITQREAELLFELNNATSEVENAPEWSDLFVKAVANYLMFPQGAPSMPDADEALRREAWLEDRRGVGGLLFEIGGSILSPDFSGAWGGLFGGRAREEAEREAARAHEAMRREAINAVEAKWLIDRLDQDSLLHENERALLAFIKRESSRIDPMLDPWFEKAGL